MVPPSIKEREKSLEHIFSVAEIVAKVYSVYNI